MSNLSPLPPVSFSDAEIRERAYYLWLDRGCPTGHDEDIWYAARALLHDRAKPTEMQHGQIVAARASDPLHHFHPPGTPADRRHTVADSGAMQRRRARAQRN